MENASKALIIAGAILLAILIIGLGIYIYNQAANSISDTGMDKLAARQFNGKFEPYLDVTLSPINAKALIDTARNEGLELTGNYTSKMKIRADKEYIAVPRYTNNNTASKIESIEIKLNGGVPVGDGSFDNPIDIPDLDDGRH